MRTEDQDFEDLEKKIGAHTTDLRPKATEEQRTWFFNEHGWYAPDADVMKAWHKRIENDK